MTTAAFRKLALMSSLGPTSLADKSISKASSKRMKQGVPPNTSSTSYPPANYPSVGINQPQAAPPTAQSPAISVNQQANTTDIANTAMNPNIFTAKVSGFADALPKILRVGAPILEEGGDAVAKALLRSGETAADVDTAHEKIKEINDPNYARSHRGGVVKKALKAFRKLATAGAGEGPTPGVADNGVNPSYPYAMASMPEWNIHKSGPQQGAFDSNSGPNFPDTMANETGGTVALQDNQKAAFHMPKIAGSGNMQESVALQQTKTENQGGASNMSKDLKGHSSDANATGSTMTADANQLAWNDMRCLDSGTDTMDTAGSVYSGGSPAV